MNQTSPIANAATSATPTATQLTSSRKSRITATSSFRRPPGTPREGESSVARGVVPFEHLAELGSKGRPAAFELELIPTVSRLSASPPSEPAIASSSNATPSSILPISTRAVPSTLSAQSSRSPSADSRARALVSRAHRSAATASCSSLAATARHSTTQPLRDSSWHSSTSRAAREPTTRCRIVAEARTVRQPGAGETRRTRAPGSERRPRPHRATTARCRARTAPRPTPRARGPPQTTSSLSTSRPPRVPADLRRAALCIRHRELIARSPGRRAGTPEDPGYEGRQGPDRSRHDWTGSAASPGDGWVRSRLRSGRPRRGPGRHC